MRQNVCQKLLPAEEKHAVGVVPQKRENLFQKATLDIQISAKPEMFPVHRDISSLVYIYRSQHAHRR